MQNVGWMGHFGDRQICREMQGSLYFSNRHFSALLLQLTSMYLRAFSVKFTNISPVPHS